VVQPDALPEVAAVNLWPVVQPADAQPAAAVDL
jgi:hypothetical protein